MLASNAIIYLFILYLFVDLIGVLRRTQEYSPIQRRPALLREEIGQIL